MSNISVYKNAVLSGVLTDITVTDGIITSLDKTDAPGFDLKGNEIFPGLIDIHTHGCLGFDATDNPEALEEMSHYYAKNGITSWYPTTLADEIDKLRSVTDINIKSVGGANVLGFHMEGPYISPNKRGALNPEFMRLPNTDEFKTFKNVKMITVAPELEGAKEFIKSCDAVVSLGHSVADFETAAAAADAGAKCLTHVFNAMPGLHHREPSLIGAAIDRNMYVQVISDGVHIHKSVITALYRIFGTDRVVLISDSVAATGLTENGRYLFGGLEVELKDGVVRTLDGALAGSTTNLFDCVKAAISFGIPKADAFKMASETPANLMGINKGRLEVGFDGDFIAVDSVLNLKNVIIGGKLYK